MNQVARSLTLGAALLAFGAVGATPAVAQDEGLPLDRESITSFARIHITVNDARDEFHGKVGRVHDEEGRRRAREELEERLEQIWEDAGVTREWYDQMILAISMDGEARTIFEEVLIELEEEGR